MRGLGPSTTSISILCFFLVRATESFTQLNQNVLSLQPHRWLSHDVAGTSTAVFSGDESTTPSTNVMEEGPDQQTLVTTFEKPSTSNARKGSPEFANFDYENHWYPCIWEEDLELNEPTKVTIFDVDYVVAKTSKGEVIAMKDFCTHKGAALSEGRITAGGNFQCAYHGWSFNGKSGKCVEIPQLVRSKGAAEGGKTKSSPKIPSRACSTAVPAQIHQGMVWLFPGGGLEKALVAPPPPSFSAKFDDMKRTTVVRDMPVDWPILLSNICDPDHGLFAHQSKNFDMYTASLDCPFESFISEETYGGQGWSLRTQVDSKSKIIEVDRSLREVNSKSSKVNSKRKRKKSKTATDPWATTHFQAPTYVQLNRVDKESGETKSLTLFYVCPVGVGRSRFMSQNLSSAKAPRWIVNFFLANFLDQDTYLLATQQRHILSREAEDLRRMMEEQGIHCNDTEKLRKLQMRTRRDTFCLPSPTDRLGSKIEQFWDATLTRCPNRVKYLLKLDDSGAFLETPSREIVLDRKTQNLDICKDSQGAVRNCRRVQGASKALALVLVLVKFGSSVASEPATVAKTVCKSSSLLGKFAVLFVVSSLAKKLENEYYFKYTDDMRRKDMKKVPKEIWEDR
mmetsp:Transcript_2608/g.3918  ORF Transcript_2608/g.3918 Transcript_2608/m.3918 type:complete len:623 (-) Transcript_2608:170-2038(-)